VIEKEKDGKEDFRTGKKGHMKSMIPISM